MSHVDNCQKSVLKDSFEGSGLNTRKNAKDVFFYMQTIYLFDIGRGRRKKSVEHGQLSKEILSSTVVVVVLAVVAVVVVFRFGRREFEVASNGDKFRDEIVETVGKEFASLQFLRI